MIRVEGQVKGQPLNLVSTHHTFTTYWILVMSKAAVQFLREHGDRSLVSLGCGNHLNRLDNHLKLLLGCDLDYYVAIDRVLEIKWRADRAFSNLEAVTSFLSQLPSRKFTNPTQFLDKIKMFPSTHVEELAGIKCRVVVCQRVLPFRHWEEIITSMQPDLVLQEDLKGCERQEFSGKNFTPSYPGIFHYQLDPFRQSRFIPWEKNILLWRRRDFFPSHLDKVPIWKKILFRFSPNKQKFVKTVEA